jgi:type I restriction enzyme R subunit
MIKDYTVRRPIPRQGGALARNLNFFLISSVLQFGQRSIPVSKYKELNMPKWKNPQLIEVANEVRQLAEAAPGQLKLFGEFLDPDADLHYREVPIGGLRVRNIEPPLLYLELEGSAIAWGVEPTKNTVLEWQPLDAKEAHAAQAVAPQNWPIDLQIAQERQRQEMTTLRPEALTRRDLIDPILEKAGWHGNRIKREVSFFYDPDRKGEQFHADYILMVDHPRHSQSTAAIIEAKRESFPPDYGLEHGKMYADILAENVRYVFATNGHEFVEYDRTTGMTSPPEPLVKFPRFEALRSAIHKTPENLWRIDKEAFTLERFVNDNKLDGDNSVMVETIAKLLLPADSLRQRCFTVLADSLVAANAHGSGKWETTLIGTGQLIRLNVGKLEVMAIFRNGLHIVLDETKLSMAQLYEIGKMAVFSHHSAYKQVPDAIACDFRAEKIDQVLPLIWTAHLSLLEQAAATVKANTGYKRYHSAGVIDYLRKVTGRKIPHPIYS